MIVFRILQEGRTPVRTGERVLALVEILKELSDFRFAEPVVRLDG